MDRPRWSGVVGRCGEGPFVSAQVSLKRIKLVGEVSIREPTGSWEEEAR